MSGGSRSKLGVRTAPGSRSEFVDGPLMTASGSTARTAGSLRRLSASAEETVVATAFTRAVRHDARRVQLPELRDDRPAVGRERLRPLRLGAGERGVLVPQQDDDPLVGVRRQLAHLAGGQVARPAGVQRQSGISGAGGGSSHRERDDPDRRSSQNRSGKGALHLEDPLQRASPPPCAGETRSMTEVRSGTAGGCREASYRDSDFARSAERNLARRTANLGASGRVAQRESTRFTREGSLVRSQPRPSHDAAFAQRRFTSSGDPLRRGTGHSRGGRLRRSAPGRRTGSPGSRACHARGECRASGRRGAPATAARSRRW